MKYKIIATDFDGTLLNDDKKITEKNINVLERYKSKSLIVGVTARNIGSVKTVANLEMFDYLILNNGTNIYDVENKKNKVIGNLTTIDIEKLTNEFINISKRIDYCTENIYYTYKNSDLIIPSYMKKINSFSEINCLVYRMNIYLNDKQKLEYYKNYINKNYKSINAFIMMDSDLFDEWLVINPININKKTTLINFAKDKKISPEEIIFFGDGLNDLEIMKSDIYSVSMANALDDVKKYASSITLSNNEDGIAEFLNNVS